MKKISNTRLTFYENRNRRYMNLKYRLTKRMQHNRYRLKVISLTDPVLMSMMEAPSRRRAKVKEVYRKKNYNNPPISVQIHEDFGIEERVNAQKFLDLASQFVDCNSKTINFDLSKCTRMWPSAVTLLCSLKHWVEMKAKPGQTPHLRSTKSEHDNVNGYLDDCGFYDYVGRAKDHSKTQHNQGEMVKIEKETEKSRIKSRRDQIRSLLTRFSSLSSDEREKFVDHVLVEVTNNVSEHGLGVHNTLGWWIIAQYHRSHQFVSICIADNGIGFRNSLLSGAQHKYIEDKYSSIIKDEGKAIKLAFEESVSGALYAPVKEKKFMGDKYERGSRRGNGLKIIREACSELGIPLAVLSHHGYLFIDALGAYEKLGHSDKRIFAGTLYHFLIPAKGDQNDKEY